MRAASLIGCVSDAWSSVLRWGVGWWAVVGVGVSRGRVGARWSCALMEERGSGGYAVTVGSSCVPLAAFFHARPTALRDLLQTPTCQVVFK